MFIYEEVLKNIYNYFKRNQKILVISKVEPKEFFQVYHSLREVMQSVDNISP
jgi:hypothetical protein